jgi:hypothetical protein
MWKNLIEVLIGPLVEYLYKFLSTKKKERTLNALRDDIKIYKELDKLVDESYINKVMFCCLTNGGAKIQPAKVKFFSIIEEAKNKGVKSVIEKYQKQMADVPLLERIISSVYSANNVSRIVVKDLPNNNLRHIFETEGVDESVIAYIASNDENLWYLKINANKSIDISDKDFLETIYHARNTIANILGEYYPLDHRI